MSTILKALRKLEGEKGEEPVLPALDAKVLVAPGEPLRRTGRYGAGLRIAGLGALVLVLLAGGGWLLWRRPAGHVVPVAAPPVAVSRPAPHPTTPPAREAAPPPAPTAPIAAAAPPAVPAPVTPAPAPPVRQAQPRAPAPQALAAAAPPVRSAAVRPPAPPAAPAASQAPPRSEARLARREPPHRPHTATRRSSTPEVAVIPPPPPIHVEEIIWHPDPQRRVATVRVEGRAKPLELHEGDAVGTLVVAEIDPGAVIFLDGASRIRKSLADSP